MTDMTWQQKAAALNALATIKLCIRKPGDWYVLQSTEIGGDGMLRGVCGNGITPEDAVESHWRKATELPPNHYVVVDVASPKERRVRWNGFMWEDASPVAQIKEPRHD